MLVYGAIMQYLTLIQLLFSGWEHLQDDLDDGIVILLCDTKKRYMWRTHKFV